MQTLYLKTALKLAQTGRYTLTARELSTSIIGIRQQVKNVEREVGFKLFVSPGGYDRGGVVLTEKGAIYLAFVIRALAMLDEGKLEATDTK